MYGFWRLGVIPAPSAGAAWVANGLATATTRNEKKTATPAKTGTTQTTRSFAQPRFSRIAAAPKPVRKRSQRSSDPSWPPQNAEIVYGVGSASLVVRATYSNEKSFRRSAASSTPAATTVEKNAATSAFCADAASRRRPRYAPAAPATSAYVARPSVTRSAARPSSGTALSALPSDDAASRMGSLRRDPSSRVVRLLRRVLRRALRDHRARLGYERPLLQATGRRRSRGRP